MFRTVSFSLAALVCVLPSQAQNVEQIVKLHTKAIGGQDAFAAVKTMRMSVKMLAGAGMEMPLNIEVRKPNQVRVDVSVMGKTIVQVMNGKESWMINPMLGSEDPVPMPSDMVDQMEGQSARFEGPLLNYKERGMTLELLGKESVDGAEAYKLKLADKKGNESVLFLDTESYLISKMTQKTKAMGQEINAVIKFGDYKAVAGMMFAHTFDVQVEGMPMASQRMTIQKIEINVPIDDSRFVMPPKATAPAAPSAEKAMVAAPSAEKPAEAKAK